MSEILSTRSLKVGTPRFRLIPPRGQNLTVRTFEIKAYRKCFSAKPFSWVGTVPSHFPLRPLPGPGYSTTSIINLLLNTYTRAEEFQPRHRLAKCGAERERASERIRQPLEARSVIVTEAGRAEAQGGGASVYCRLEIF